jgi:AcrR family transcriptional regulator
MTTQQAAAFGGRFDVFRSRDAQVSADAPRRDRILDAARRCYVTLGWDKTTMEDVGRIAGMSRATLYKNFPTSEELHRAVRSQAVDMMRRDFEDALGEGEDLADSLGNVAAALTVWCSTMRSVDNPNALYFRIHAEESAVIIDVLEDVLAPRMAAARRAGEISKGRDIERAVAWVARCVAGFALLPTGRDSESDYPFIAREFISEFIVSAL